MTQPQPISLETPTPKIRKVTFATWFDTHAVATADACELAESLPLSRVYEVIDESVRQARFREELAASLRGRVR